MRSIQGANIVCFLRFLCFLCVGTHSPFESLWFVHAPTIQVHSQVAPFRSSHLVLMHWSHVSTALCVDALVIQAKDVHPAATSQIVPTVDDLRSRKLVPTLKRMNPRQRRAAAKRRKQNEIGGATPGMGAT